MILDFGHKILNFAAAVLIYIKLFFKQVVSRLSTYLYVCSAYMTALLCAYAFDSIWVGHLISSTEYNFLTRMKRTNVNWIMDIRSLHFASAVSRIVLFAMYSKSIFYLYMPALLDF